MHLDFLGPHIIASDLRPLKNSIFSEISILARPTSGTAQARSADAFSVQVRAGRPRFQNSVL